MYILLLWRYYNCLTRTRHEHISRSKLDLIKHFKLYHVKVWNKPKALHLRRGTTVSSGESLNGRRNGTNKSLDRSLSKKAGSHGFTHESRIDGVPVLLIMDTMFTGMPRHVASPTLTVNLTFESARRLEVWLFFLASYVVSDNLFSSGRMFLTSFNKSPNDLSLTPFFVFHCYNSRVVPNFCAPIHNLVQRCSVVL